MKIIDSKECKVYKFTYTSTCGFLKLLYPVSEEKSLTMRFTNEAGAGMYDYYIINSIGLGWGPYAKSYWDPESYEIYTLFARTMFEDKSTYLGQLYDSKWKVMDCDIYENYNKDGVELYSSSDCIKIYKLKDTLKDTFYFYCDQKYIDDIETYDKYLSNVENIREAEKILRGE